MLLVLQCYGFTKSWMVSPADGEARGPRPASGLSASSKLRREDQSEARGNDLALLASVKQTDFSTPRRLDQSNCSCGAEPRPRDFLAMLTSSDI